MTNPSARGAALRARGGLAVRFSEEAIAARAAEPRTTRGGRPRCPALAIAAALALRAVFRLALRRTEGSIGSILALLGLDPAVPDHTTPSRRAEALAVPRPRSGKRPAHPLVDSTGLRLCGPGEWPAEKRGTKRRRAWRKPRLATDAGTGRVLASAPTDRRADDGPRAGPPLDQIDGPVASFTGDGAHDRDGVYASVAARHPGAGAIVPPRSGAAPSGAAEAAPTQRDAHLRCIAERGRMGWQRASGCGWRALVASGIPRWKRVVGDGPRSRTDGRQATEAAIAADAVDRMLALGRPECVRIG